MQANPLENIIANAAKGGWDWFEKVDPQIREMVDARQAKASEDARSISSAWAWFYSTPQGKKALEALFDSTLRRTVFFAQLGLDPSSMAVWGAFREGQNAVAHEIARQIGLGMNEETKPRDV